MFASVATAAAIVDVAVTPLVLPLCTPILTAAAPSLLPLDAQPRYGIQFTPQLQLHTCTQLRSLCAADGHVNWQTFWIWLRALRDRGSCRSGDRSGAQSGCVSLFALKMIFSSLLHALVHR